MTDVKSGLLSQVAATTKRVIKLEKENAELKEHHKSVCETLTNTHRSIREHLTKAADLLKKMYYLYFDPCVTHKDLENRDKLFEEVKQFIKEQEK